MNFIFSILTFELFKYKIMKVNNWIFCEEKKTNRMRKSIIIIIQSCIGMNKYKKVLKKLKTNEVIQLINFNY